MTLWGNNENLWEWIDDLITMKMWNNNKNQWIDDLLKIEFQAQAMAAASTDAPTTSSYHFQTDSKKREEMMTTLCISFPHRWYERHCSKI